MDTGIRRFILRLAIGLLAFLLGITAAWALGGFVPFQNSPSGERQQYRYRRYRYYRSELAPPASERSEGPAAVEPTYLVGPHGCRMKRDFGAPPAPPSPPAPPMR